MQIKTIYPFEMDLPSKIKLIDALIYENRDVTAKEYLEDLYEIERIERKTNEPCPLDVTPKMISAELRNCAIAV